MIRNRKGFTLIELLVVIAIIAILAAILFPVFAQAREKARQASCGSNMKQIATGIKMYASDFDEQGPQWWYQRNFPSTGVNGPWMEMTNPYVKNTDLFMCPSAPKTLATYTTQCAGTTIKSTYTMPSWLYYDYYLWFGGTVMFAGFPSGIVPPNASGVGGTTTACPPSRPWSECRTIEFVENPADAAMLVEGYVSTFFPTAGTQFGSACTTGLSGDATGQVDRHIWRHNEGMNVAFCDGHMKWFKASNIWRNNSHRHTYQGELYEASPFMRVGN